MGLGITAPLCPQHPLLASGSRKRTLKKEERDFFSSMNPKEKGKQNPKGRSGDNSSSNPSMVPDW